MMHQSRSLCISVVATFVLFFCLSQPVRSEDAPEEANVNGKYSNLIQVLYCPSDRGQYGEFRDYGHWGGGAWCGKRGKSGYWVWVSPNWYIWSDKGQRVPKPPILGSDREQNVPDRASVDGKYFELLQVLKCPSDRGQYGEFNDYGYWGGGSWCGKQGRAGYWVWVAPNWYIWKRK